MMFFNVAQRLTPLLFLLVLSLPVKSQETNFITIVGTETAVYHTDDQGEVVGDFADYIRDIFQKASVPARLLVVPPMRAMHQVESTPNTCLLTQYRQRERRHPVKWIFPNFATTFGLYGLKDQATLLKQKEPKSLRITAVMRDTSTQTAIRSGYVIDSPVPKHQLGLRMLKAGRVDVISLTSPGAEVFGQSAKVDLVEIVRLGQGVQWFSCHPSIDDTVVEQLCKAWKEGYRAGKLHAFMSPFPGMNIPTLERIVKEQFDTQPPKSTYSETTRKRTH